MDRILPHLHPNSPIDKAEGFHPKERKKSTLLVLAITLHNIPEGLAVGIAFGALANGGTVGSLAGAIDTCNRNWYTKPSRRSCCFNAS